MRVRLYGKGRSDGRGRLYTRIGLLEWATKKERPTRWDKASRQQRAAERVRVIKMAMAGRGVRATRWERASR